MPQSDEKQTNPLDMGPIIDGVSSKLTELGEKYPPETAIAIMEITQREIHHRERMFAKDREEELMRELISAIYQK